MDAVETYFSSLLETHFAGVPETSNYPALANLFNEVGKGLSPRVRCIINPKNQGAGIPDGGPFTLDQLNKTSPMPNELPARGVIEVKSTKDDAWVTADGPQVTKYWGKYRQVLVTNLRDFVLVGQDSGGNSVKLETFRLASQRGRILESGGQASSLRRAEER